MRPKPGTALADIKTVVSTRTRSARAGSGWRRSCPTPSRGRQLHRRGRPAGGEVEQAGRAAIATALGAKLSGLELLASDIEDHPENQTRFVVVGHGIPAPTGHDKTSIVCFQRQDRPGSLLAILQEFAARAINLTKLESRPTKRGLGDYCFFIDFEGHIADELVADCLRNLAAKQAEVKFLGSYPVAGRRGHVRRQRRRPRRGATRPRGSTACASRSATTPSDAP